MGKKHQHLQVVFNNIYTYYNLTIRMTLILVDGDDKIIIFGHTKNYHCSTQQTKNLKLDKCL